MSPSVALALFAAWAGPAFAAPPRVLVAEYEGVIGPPAAEYLESAVDAAARGGQEALVVALDTPGGLDASMRRIVKSFLSAPVPVIVYVSPAGARAASAGVFITMAADVAAMAPGTNIGAAHPVQLGGPASGGGEKSPRPRDAVMEAKLSNDASAYLSAIAARRGRNAQWAEYVVAQSSSVPSAEAVRLRVVDLEAASLPALLQALDGRKLAGRSSPLRLREAVLERFPMSARQRLLTAVSDPNVAMVLMSLGVSGLLIELYSPGLILPGIVGAVSLVLSFYSSQTLTAGSAGLALIGLGVLFMILELKFHSFGFLGLSGAAAFVFGALMLSRGAAGGGVPFSPGVLAVSAGLLLVTFGGLLALARSVLRRRPRTGGEGLLGQTAETLSALAPAGTVRLYSETWNAVAAEGPVEAGVAVVVVGREGLTLKVRRKA